ncbi:MAG TPA: ATPase domain-containing protein [Methylotenera sp.]|nr:ATPase domain-containing protein [Methylotenera sp.]
MNSKVSILRLATGVPGLDAILGGGLPELSFNLIVGSPGSGKTTLAHQIMFALATPERPALFFTVLGEAPLKMLRYQQQFSFFDAAMINKSIHFVNLNDEVASGDLDQVLQRISNEVAALSPALVFIDSFRSVVLETQLQIKGTLGLQQFIQQLGMQMTSWQATTFLIGEQFNESYPHPVFTVADGLISLTQKIQRNSMVRQLHVLKMRGQPTSPGMHTFRITNEGVQVFPSAVIRNDTEAQAESDQPRSRERVSMGVPGLDKMLGGGLPSGYSLLVAGPSGSGKTILATAFLTEGVKRGEPGIIVAFEQTPSQSWNRSIDDMVRAGQIGLINTRSLDLSIDEIVQHLIDLIHKMKATRVVIDSLSGFELAVAPTFREDFRESLFRMVAVLSSLGVTVLMTSELEDRYTDLRFSPYGTAFLTDAIIVQRYIEVESSLQRVMAVVKVRASVHSQEICKFEIGKEGIIIGEPILDYEGLLGGRPTLKYVSKASKG